MSASSPRTAFVGFGEAAMAFAEGWAGGALSAFDIKTDDPAAAAAKRADYKAVGISGAATLAEAVAGADLVIAVVTADQALAAAKAASPLLAPGALYCDFDSVAPDTKRAAALIVESGGARYVDVAVMGPVRPAGRSVPLLVSGPYAEAACGRLAEVGFQPRTTEGPVGTASLVKMLRSVMVKGLEALTAECFLAAHRAGAVDAVRDTLAQSWPGVDWAAKADYNLERMLVHGVRRAAEMEEAAAMLDSLGTGSTMTRATVERQREIGRLGLPAPNGLAAKSALILDQRAPSR